MTKDATHHEASEAEEWTVASSLADGEPCEGHLARADRHSQIASPLRNTDANDVADLPAKNFETGGRSGDSLSQAIHQPRLLLAQSHRLLAEIASTPIKR